MFINNPGRMIKIVAIPIYGKNLSKIFYSGNGVWISTKLGTYHLGLKTYNVFINRDPVMNLTYFMSRST